MDVTLLDGAETLLDREGVLNTDGRSLGELREGVATGV